MGLQNKFDEKLSRDKMNHLKEQLHSVIYGLAIGDALGVPVEFNERDTYHIYHITKMEGYGTYNQPPGTCSYLIFKGSFIFTVLRFDYI